MSDDEQPLDAVVSLPADAVPEVASTEAQRQRYAELLAARSGGLTAEDFLAAFDEDPGADIPGQLASLESRIRAEGRTAEAMARSLDPTGEHRFTASDFADDVRGRLQGELEALRSSVIRVAGGRPAELLAALEALPEPGPGEAS